MKDDYIKKFYNEINKELDGDYKIILEPRRNLKEPWIEYDQVKWEMDKPIKELVDKLLKNNTLNFEEKLLKVYEFICLNYVYDVNVLYFFKKDVSDPDNIKYIAVDWYGRIIDEKWKENRKKHNRRVCYEFARFYAKAINELLEKNSEYEAFMLGDKTNLHYVVGLTGKDYSAILDLDNFNSLKDLARLKLGLTIKGIKILRDDTGRLQKAINEFNKNKLEELVEVEKIKKELKGVNTEKYLTNVANVLNSYNIDPQGFFEYMRIIIEDENIEIEKIWKEIKDVPEKRYVRCLIFNINSKTFLLDSDTRMINAIKKDELDKNIFVFNPEENYYNYYGG
ncbi:MAG: hypothetical protein ACLSG7_05870 [Clostridia bacterium]